jgi:hypothetical protein
MQVCKISKSVLLGQLNLPLPIRYKGFPFIFVTLMVPVDLILHMHTAVIYTDSARFDRSFLLKFFLLHCILEEC